MSSFNAGGGSKPTSSSWDLLLTCGILGGFGRLGSPEFSALNGSNAWGVGYTVTTIARPVIAIIQLTPECYVKSRHSRFCWSSDGGCIGAVGRVSSYGFCFAHPNEKQLTRSPLAQLRWVCLSGASANQRASPPVYAVCAGIRLSLHDTWRL